MDITHCLTAYRRSNGEYCVFLEDDTKSRWFMYRWCPDGNCDNGTKIRGGSELVTKCPPAAFSILDAGFNANGKAIRLSFSVPNDTRYRSVRFVLSDLRGRTVAALDVTKSLRPGENSVSWAGGAVLAAGTYLLRMEAIGDAGRSSVVEARRITLAP